MVPPPGERTGSRTVSREFAIAVDELLSSARWRFMQLGTLFHQSKARAKFVVERIGLVAYDIEPLHVAPSEMLEQKR
jgi:hypothetical protein